MSALDDLQRSLSRAVADGRAADPALAGDRDAARSTAAAVESTDHVSDAPRRRGRFARLRPRRGWHVFLTILVAGGLTTGALAATGQLRTISAREPQLPPNSRQYGGVRVSDGRVLSLRVADPEGGPPWALRAFTTNREAACVQVGQIYRGQFGETELDRAGRVVFRRREAQQGADGVMCSGLERNGFAVLRGDRELIRRGRPKPGFDPTFGSCSMVRNACELKSMLVVRWGMLGPGARSATFLDSAGRRTEQQVLSPSDGGGYLFVEKVDPAPYEAYERVTEAFDRRMSKLGEGKSLRDRADLQNREFRRHLPELRDAERRLKRTWDAIDATFVGGVAMRVAGKGRRGGRLPGVEHVRSDLPASVAASLSLRQKPGRRGPIVVSFRSPVELTRFDRHFVVTFIGPVGPRCGTETRRNRYVTTTSFGLGAPVNITLQPYTYDRARQPWCSKPHSIRVTLATGSSNGGKLVGAASFTPR